MPTDKPLSNKDRRGLRSAKRKERQKVSAQISKSDDRSTGFTPYTFSKLISDNPDAYKSVFDTCLKMYKTVHYNGNYYIYSENKHLYRRVSRDQYIENVLAPALYRNKIAIDRPNTLGVLHHISSGLPPLGNARDKVNEEESPQGFILSSGRKIEHMPASINQLVLIDSNDDFKIKIFEDRNSDHFFTSASPIPVAPEEQTERPENWKAYLQDAFPDNEEAWVMVEEVIGCVLYKPDLPNIILCLIGQGGAGKGVLTRLLIKLVGEHPHFETSQLVKLSSRFTASAFFDKRLMILSDLPELTRRTQRVMESLSILKNVTGGDGILLEEKGKNPYTVKPNIIPIVSTNFKKLNWISDAEDAQAWLRRIIPVHFLHAKEEGRIADLEERLATPELVRWCLQQYAAAKRRNGGEVGQKMFTRDRHSYALEASLRGDKLMSAEEYVSKYFEFTGNPKDILTVSEVKPLLETTEARDQSLKTQQLQQVLRGYMDLKLGEKLPQRKVKGKVVRVYTGIRYARPKVEREALSILDSFGELDKDGNWSSG